MNRIKQTLLIKNDEFGNSENIKAYNPLIKNTKTKKLERVYPPDINFESKPLIVANVAACIALVAFILGIVVLVLLVTMYGIWFRGNGNIVYTNRNVTVVGNVPDVKKHSFKQWSSGGLEFRNSYKNKNTKISRILCLKTNVKLNDDDDDDDDDNINEDGYGSLLFQNSNNDSFQSCLLIY